MKCKFCNKEFVKRKKAKFCSKVCRWKLWKKNNPEKVREHCSRWWKINGLKARITHYKKFLEKNGYKVLEE